MTAPQALYPIRCPCCGRTFEARYADRKACVVCPLCASPVILSPDDFEPLVLMEQAERRRGREERRSLRRNKLKQGLSLLLKAGPVALGVVLLIWFLSPVWVPNAIITAAVVALLVSIAGTTIAIAILCPEVAETLPLRPTPPDTTPPPSQERTEESSRPVWDLGEEAAWLAGDWYDFETKVFLMFQKKGYHSMQTGPQQKGFDGTVELPEGVFGVEVKRYCETGEREVDGESVQKLYEDLLACGLSKGIIATTGRVAPAARNIAQELPVRIEFFCLADLCREGRRLELTPDEIIRFREVQGIELGIPAGMVAARDVEPEDDSAYPF